MADILLNVTTTDGFKDNIQAPEINLIREKRVNTSDYNSFSPEISNMMMSFLVGIPASMIASFLMERIKSFIKKSGNEVFIQGHSVQIKLDPSSTDVDYENAIIKLTPKE